MEDAHVTAILEEIRGNFRGFGDGLAALDEKVEHGLKALDEKVDLLFGRLDGKVGRLDEKVGRLDEKVGRLDEKVTRLDEKVTGIDEKVDALATDMADVKVRLTRVERIVVNGAAQPKRKR